MVQRPEPWVRLMLSVELFLVVAFKVTHFDWLITGHLSSVTAALKIDRMEQWDMRNRRLEQKSSK